MINFFMVWHLVHCPSVEVLYGKQGSGYGMHLMR
jgi:hypothetical protein